jgi:hypothetical protein
MDDKTYFSPGDTVELKQNINNKPVMVVKSVDKANAAHTDTGYRAPVLLGITCFWFTTTGEYQLQRFNTKDLQHVEKQV